MKKICISIITIVLVFLSIPVVKANSSLPNWEFIPSGYNYLEDSNFTYTVGDPINYGTVSCLNYIRVKASTSYMVNMYNYQEGKLLGVTVYHYNSDKELLNQLTTELNIAGEDEYYTFTTTNETKYITLEMAVMEEYGANLELYRIEYNYSMIEGTDYAFYSSLSVNDLIYQGPSVDYSPVISGNNGLYITSFENPVSFSTIRSSVIAMDDNDGDITSQIIVTKNDYINHMNEIGTYEIVFSVTDSSNNTTNFSVFVMVMDMSAPIITGKNSYTTNQLTKIEISNIEAGLSANDNYDGDVTPSIAVKTDNYTSNYATPGTYLIVFTATDTAGNIAEYSVSVVVSYYDNIPPTFSGTFTYEIANNQKLTIQDIINNIVVTDNIDGIITNRVTVAYDYYTYSTTRIGTWKVGLLVKDNNNNQKAQEITITVTDKTSPIFLIDTQVINIDLSNNTMEISDFVDFLERTQTIKEGISYEIITDEYSENKKTPGTYKIVLDVEGEELELQINIIENLDEDVEEEGLLQKIAWFFIDLWQDVVSFFKRIF
ncbi:MAG: hypothetical protein PHO86_01420 [Bacilli bacterium]|nr:hypothetical protein [Bacilli bacterium]